MNDPKITTQRYTRTPEQNEMLGLNATEPEPAAEVPAEGAEAVTATAKDGELTGNVWRSVISFFFD